ncbi:MAG TPA: alpha/beta hydrolase [Hyphomicrobium sp.]|nr:alpha/beta hydrolase [Hyphomicrobium sp.]
MRTLDADILMVPGLNGSAPDHWQSRWERNLRTARRVEQDDWDRPDKDLWVGSVIRAVAASARPAVLVAHSLGVHAVAYAAEKLPQGAVSGAFLVAPPDLDNPQRFPAEINETWPADGFGFSPVPMRRLTFPSLLLASASDPFCTLERAQEFAAAWGAGLVDIGPAGHINAASGYGPWPDGVLRFGAFLKQLG